MHFNDLKVSVRRALCTFLLIVLLAVSALNANAAVLLGVNFDNTNTGGVSAAVNVGWEFTISSPISVTQLGFWDALGDGFGEAHPVGIWNTSGSGGLASALVSATVPIGTGASLVGSTWFRMVAVTPTTLPAGDYVIGGRLPGNQVDLYQDASASNVVFGSGITFTQKRFGGDATFDRPDNTGAGVGIFGPNFTFNAVPEPSSIVLAAAGLVGVAGWGWRRRRRSP